MRSAKLVQAMTIVESMIRLRMVNAKSLEQAIINAHTLALTGVSTTTGAQHTQKKRTHALIPATTAICRDVAFFLYGRGLPRPVKHKYKPAKQKLAPFKNLFSGKDGKAILAEVDKVCLHDAVLNVAVVWKDIWGKF
jgi:hypothetical protein